MARILVVQHHYPPAALGGYGVMCAQVCQWLVKRGHDLLVLSAQAHQSQSAAGAGNQDDEEDEGRVRVRRVLATYWDDVTQECVFPSFADAYAIEQANHAHLRAALASHRPEVVSFWHMGAMSLGLITTTARLGVPIMFVVGDDWLCYGGWADGWLRRFAEDPDHDRAVLVERRTGLPTRLPIAELGRLATFCFVSDHLRRRAEQAGGWRMRRWSVTHPGVATASFPPVRPNYAGGRALRWSWRLVWVGRVTEGKGVATAIEALSLLPEQTRMDIVGPVQPAVHARLQTLAAACGVSGRIGFAVVPHQQMQARYQRGDVTLFTSELAHEAFGLVQLEAMASGCPLVTTAVGGSVEYCRDGDNCLVVPAGDGSALAAAVRRLAEDPGLRRRLVDGGLRAAAALTIDRHAARIEQALVTAAAETPGRLIG